MSYLLPAPEAMEWWRNEGSKMSIVELYEACHSRRTGTQNIEWCETHGERGKTGYFCPAYGADSSDEALADCSVVSKFLSDAPGDDE